MGNKQSLSQEEIELRGETGAIMQSKDARRFIDDHGKEEDE